MIYQSNMVVFHIVLVYQRVHSPICTHYTINIYQYLYTVYFKYIVIVFRYMHKFITCSFFLRRPRNFRTGCNNIRHMRGNIIMKQT